MASPGVHTGSVPIAVAVMAANAEAIAWMALGICFMTALGDVLAGGAPRLVLGFVFSSVVTYGALRTLLSAGACHGLKAMRAPHGMLPWAFLVRMLLLSLPGFLAMIVTASLAALLLGDGHALFLGMIVWLIVGYATLALFGSMLVDIANGGEGDAQAALMRGRQVFVPVLIALLAGPALAELMYHVGARVLAMSPIPASAVVAAGPTDPGGVSPTGMAVELVSYAARAFIGVLTAVVLGRAWLQGS